MFITSLNANAITYLCLFIFSFIIAIIFFMVNYLVKKQTAKTAFGMKNVSDQGVWAFTKRHFFMFSGLFFFVIFITSLVLFVKEL